MDKQKKPATRETVTVIARHSKGRFVVMERSGRCLLGGTYHIREAVLTPEKDSRGTFSPKWSNDTWDIPSLICTDTEKNEILTRYQNGASPLQIADIMDKPYADIVQLLKQAGVWQYRCARFTSEEKQAIADLWRQGIDVPHISLRTGRSKSAIYCFLTTAGLREKKRPR